MYTSHNNNQYLYTCRFPTCSSLLMGNMKRPKNLSTFTQQLTN